MPIERREGVTRSRPRVNGKPEEPRVIDGRRQPSAGGTSRMTRECHVRICEGLGAKFPGATRRQYPFGPAASPSETQRKETTMSALRTRMIDDMTLAGLAKGTQQMYVNHTYCLPRGTSRQLGIVGSD